jgi:hypothetical protein
MTTCGLIRALSPVISSWAYRDEGISPDLSVESLLVGPRALDLDLDLDAVDQTTSLIDAVSCVLSCLVLIPTLSPEQRSSEPRCPFQDTRDFLDFHDCYVTARSRLFDYIHSQIRSAPTLAAMEDVQSVQCLTSSTGPIKEMIMGHQDQYQQTITWDNLQNAGKDRPRH